MMRELGEVRRPRYFASPLLHFLQGRTRISTMKRRDLTGKIATAAKAHGLDWVLARNGGGHDIYSLDGLMIVVPRHNEIVERTAESVLKSCEPKLGNRWWK
jgi:hypothetical protein